MHSKVHLNLFQVKIAIACKVGHNQQNQITQLIFNVYHFDFQAGTRTSPLGRVRKLLSLVNPFILYRFPNVNRIFQGINQEILPPFPQTWFSLQFNQETIELKRLCHTTNRARVMLDRVRPSGSEAAALRGTPSLTRFFCAPCIVLHLPSTVRRPIARMTARQSLVVSHSTSQEVPPCFMNSRQPFAPFSAPPREVSITSSSWP